MEITDIDSFLIEKDKQIIEIDPSKMATIKIGFRRGNKEYSFYLNAVNVIQWMIDHESFTSEFTDVKSLEKYTIENKIKQALLIP
jgi:hypothetical protein